MRQSFGAMPIPHSTFYFFPYHEFLNNYNFHVCHTRALKHGEGKESAWSLMFPHVSYHGNIHFCYNPNLVDKEQMHQEKSLSKSSQ